MSKKQVIYVVLSLLLSFLILHFYPVNGAFEFKNFLFLIPLFALQGALAVVYSLTNLPAFFLAANLLLLPLSRHALSITLWIIYGVMRVRDIHKNLINPDLRLATGTVFSTPFTLLALLSTLLIYPSLSFRIPDEISNMAVDLTLKMYGSYLPCNPDYTLDLCVEEMYSRQVEEQCKGDSTCIAILKSQEESIKERLRKSILSQYPSMNATTTLREAIKGSVMAPIENALNQYGNALKIVAALGLIFAFQIAGKIAEPIGYILAIVLLKVLKKTGGIRERIVKVDKVIYEV